MDVEQPTSKRLGTVLVVGGCGFLGAHVVDQLLNFPSEDENYSSKASSNDNTILDQRNSTKPTDPQRLTFPSLRSRYPTYKDTSVHVLDLRCTHNRLPGASYHEGDITSSASVLDVFKTVKPDIVINTASPQYSAPKAILRKVNIEGTRILLEVAAGKHGNWGGSCKAFVHTSSASVVHDGASDLFNADETYPYVIPNRIEYYAETKALAEKLVLSANNSPEYNNLLTCAIRPAGITGENDKGGIGPGLMVAGSTGRPWQLHVQLGSGNSLFSVTYAGNVSYALVLAAEALCHTFERRESDRTMPLEHEKVDGEAMNVTNDSPVYFWDLVHYYWSLFGDGINRDKVVVLPTGLAYYFGIIGEAISGLTGRPSKLTRQNIKYMTMQRFFSCDKLRRRCGYVPLVGVEEAVQRGAKSYLHELRTGTDVVEKKVQ